MGIACTSLISTAASFGPVMSTIAGCVLLVIYQCFLSLAGGADYILTAPRLGLFSANREGILSCAGYLAIHWISVGVGALVSSLERPAHHVVRGLLLLSLISIGSTVAL